MRERHHQRAPIRWLAALALGALLGCGTVRAEPGPVPAGAGTPEASTSSAAPEPGAPEPGVPSLTEGGSAGRRAPPFTAEGPEGHPVVLADLLARGPVVLVFYRGHW